MDLNRLAITLSIPTFVIVMISGVFYNKFIYYQDIPLSKENNIGFIREIIDFNYKNKKLKCNLSSENSLRVIEKNFNSEKYVQGY